MTDDPIRALAGAAAERRRLHATRDLTGDGLNAFLHARGAAQDDRTGDEPPQTGDDSGQVPNGDENGTQAPGNETTLPGRRTAPFLAQGARGGLPAPAPDPGAAFRQWADGELYDRPHHGGIVNR